jgi:hypothetical protein
LLSQLAKTFCLSYYCLCLLFSKIREEGRIGSAWKQGEWGGERGNRGQGREMTHTMYAHMNILIKKKEIKNILSFAGKWMELENIILSKIRLRRPKLHVFPQYVDYRPKTNAVILLDTNHTEGRMCTGETGQ